ncbi:hypothetical protein V6N13_051538 [Hibiscus sabdariffa]|uniref:Uncharacterized protein n=1 Tax=Hibiscus sabdariffa TaxID=183260 RepID=A0ABR2T4A7_9ROSI
MPAAAPFSLIFWLSSAVLVAVGCALCLEALLCSLYAHGLKDGTVFFSLANRREITEAIFGGNGNEDDDPVEADDLAEAHPHEE